MSKLEEQCERCNDAEYGEALYRYNGELLCRFCIVADVCENGRDSCEYELDCDDKTNISKQPKPLQLKESDFEIREYNYTNTKEFHYKKGTLEVEIFYFKNRKFDVSIMLNYRELYSAKYKTLKECIDYINQNLTELFNSVKE